MLHPNQQKIAKSKARFKILVCGRRFGKTTYSAEEMRAFAIYQPNPVRYFATTVDQARDIIWKELWQSVIDTPNFIKKDEQRLEVWLRSHLGFENVIKLAGWDNI